MSSYSFLSSFPLGFIGCGSIAQSFIKGYLQHDFELTKKIFISGRNLKKTQRIAQKFQVSFVSNNEELLEKTKIIFICVKPVQAKELIQKLKNNFQPEHSFLSLMAGLSFKQLKIWGLKSKRLIRIMPNISVSIGKGFLPFCSLNNLPTLNSFTEEILKPLGKTLNVQTEKLLTTSTVASASGLAFILELMQYWLEWLEGEGFPMDAARELVIENFLGAAELCNKSKKSLPDLQKAIISPKGVTLEGLTAMREMELERVLRICFEKTKLKIKNIKVKVQQQNNDFK